MTDRNKRPDPQLVWRGVVPALDPAKSTEFRLVRVLLAQAEVEEQNEQETLVAGRGHFWALEFQGFDAMAEQCWRSYDDLSANDDNVPTSADVLSEIVALLAREARGLRAVK